jgi:hypothetical protein
MNANELADYLEKSIEVTYYDMTSEPYAEIVDESYEIICQAATTLRQQQAEIEALKAELAKLQLKPYQYQAGNDILCGQIHNPLYRNQQQGQVKQGYGAEFEEWIGKAQEK